MPSGWNTLALLLCVASALAQQSDIVQTTLGPIQGTRKDVDGLFVDVYYGIPFAKPPVGPLRFKHPQPAAAWAEVRQTTVTPNSCVQLKDTSSNHSGVEKLNPNTPVSEDCLYLNVWVPRGRPEPANATLVWIYGGAFSSGTSTLAMYDGAKLAAMQNVIVASMNYRLGPLGFLYTGSPDAPGNQGLMDQTMALKWIHDNVASFGGSQDTITIFGESAGAASAGLHLLSPLSMNYFGRAVLQSGSPTAGWAVQDREEAKGRSQKLARDMGCSVNSIAAIETCLREKDAVNLIAAMLGVTKLMFDVPFAPVVDENFLPKHPAELVAKGEVKDTEIIIGANKDEGMFWFLFFYPDLFPYDNSGQISRADLQTVVSGLFPPGEDRRVEALMYQYVDDVLPSRRDSFRNVADDVWGDELFICPVVDFAAAFSALGGNRRAFLYSFQHRLSNDPWPQWTGVKHGYEIEAVFGLPVPFSYTAREVDLASRVTHYWTHFAKFGHPTGDDNVWPAMTTEGLKYLTMTDMGDTLDEGLRYHQCTFRHKMLPLLYQESISTTKPTCLGTGETTRVISTYLSYLPALLYLFLAHVLFSGDFLIVSFCVILIAYVYCLQQELMNTWTRKISDCLRPTGV